MSTVAYPVVDGRCSHCGHVKPVWTPQAITAAMRAFHAIHGRAPKQQEWRRAKPDSPAHTTVREIFGTWRAAIVAAGLPLPMRSNTMKEWTRDETIQAIFDWNYLNGRLPRAHEWSLQTEWRPSERQVRRLFGTWNAALIAAGYEPTLRKSNNQPRPLKHGGSAQPGPEEEA